MISRRHTIALFTAVVLLAATGCSKKTEQTSTVATPAAPATTPKEPSPFAPENIRATLGLAAGVKVQYAAEDGTVVSYEEFEKRAAKGQSVMLVKDEKTGDVTVRLQSAESMARLAAEAEAHLKAHPIQVPAIDLTDLAGRHYHDADLRGRPTLLSFFFDTCAPCIKEVPVLNAFALKHPEFNYLAITFDSAAAAKAFVQQRKLAWPVVADARPFIDSAGVNKFPTYLLLGADGHLVADNSGMDQRAMTDVDFGVQQLESWVDAKLAAK